MEDVKWLEIAVNTSADKLDEVTARLAANGMDSIVIEEEGEFRQFLEQNRQYWDYVDDELLEKMRGVARVKFYVTDDADGHAQLARYTQGLDCEYSQTALGENDWAYSWQKYYKPLTIGERLYVVPQWEKDQPVPAGKTAVYLDPGLTFGTGSHASTQLCLEGVEEHTAPGCSVLDLGCGSGILSIAALVLGAGYAAAVDIDPKAVGVAYENAALNGIGKDIYHVCAGDVIGDEELAGRLAERRYDLVLALLEQDGVFLCSGIIDSRADEVAAALAVHGLTVTKKREKNGWAALEARLG